MNDVRKLIRELSGASAHTAAVAAARVAGTLTAKSRRSEAERLLQYALECAEKTRWGRARAALLVALALTPGRLQRAERAPILAASNPFAESRSPLLELLRRDDLQDYPALAARLPTYQVLEALAARFRNAWRAYVSILRRRPPNLLKSLLAAADIAFLLRQSDGTLASDLRELLAELDDQLSTPEEWSSAVSVAIADAIAQHPMTSAESSAEVWSGWSADELRPVLRFAALRHAVHELTKKVSLFGYTLELRTSRRKCHIYYLVPPNVNFELYYRSGLVQTELQGAKVFTELPRDAPLMSMSELGRILTNDAVRHDIVDEPWPRARLHLIEPASGVYDKLLQVGYLDDYVSDFDAFYERLLPAHALLATEVTENLTVAQLLLLHRRLRLIGVLHTGMLSRISATGPRLVVNSLLPVLSRSTLELFLKTPDLPEGTVRDFLETLSVSPSARFVDLQYTPILQLPGGFILLPRVTQHSSIIRNTLSSQRLRVPLAGDAFNADVGASLRSRFAQVVTNKRVSLGEERGEVDVVLLEGDTLYLFECKHALLGASTHEHMWLWGEICEGVEQLARCERILADPARREECVRNWFPNAKGMVTKIRKVLVTSVRVFSGIDIGGVSVRDWFGLRGFLETGESEVAENVGPAYVGTVWSTWAGETPTQADLDEHLSSTGKLSELKRSWMCALSDIKRRHGDVAIVWETFVANLPYGEEGAELMAALGFRFVRHFERAHPQFIGADEFLAGRNDAEGSG